MTSNDIGIQVVEPTPGRFWLLKRIAPYFRIAVLGFLPCPDLIGRIRVRCMAHRLVTLRTWPGMEANSAEAAQLALMRLLWLQRQTRRAVRGRHREAAAMLARASVEALFLGLYCLRVPGAVARLHADNIKALGDGFAYFEEAGIVPAQVIRDCAGRLGEPSRRYLGVWEMVKAVDEANDNKSARSVYHRLYVPLSNFTVHARGGTLMRQVRLNGKLRWQPSRSWNRRSAARVADAAAGLLAADIAQRGALPYKLLLTYANRHMDRTILPMAVMAFSGQGGSIRPRRVLESVKSLKKGYTYLWTGLATADPLDVRVTHIREWFASMLDLRDSDIPEDALDPFINYVADKLANSVPASETST